MAILKYKLGNGWNILYKEFFQKVVTICNQALQRNKNLSDLDDIPTARQNLGLDEIYIRKDNPTVTVPFVFADNTWNKLGNDALFGDKDKTGKFAIKGQKDTIQTGIAFVASNSSDDSNYGVLNYTGTQFTVDKPFYATEGFTCKPVNEADLNNFRQSGFFYGSANSSSSILPDNFDNHDFAGICIGDFKDGEDAHPEIAQIVFDSNRIFYREWDTAVEWLDWKEFAFKSDIPTDSSAEIQAALTGYAKKDGSNITSIATWATALNTGTITSSSTGLVSGKKVYTAIEEAKSGINTSLGNYAKKDASNLSTANITSWTTALNKGSVAKNNTGLISGGKVYTYVTDSINTLKTSINSSISSLQSKIDTLTSAVSTAAKFSRKSFTAAGYIEFDGNLMLQWGKQKFTGNYITAFVNFNQPFEKVYAITAIPQRASGSGAGGTYTCHMLNSGIEATGFSMKSQIEDGSGEQYIHWIAIGKPLDPSKISEGVTVKFTKQDNSKILSFTVTYTDTVSASKSSSNPSSLTIKKGSKITIKNTKKDYHVVVKQGSTQKANLAYNGTWTSGAISAATTFTLSASYDYESYDTGGSDGCCVAEGTLVTCYDNGKFLRKKIEEIQSGDIVVGANKQLNEVYARTDTVLGKDRNMFTFIDNSLYFTGEHSMWVCYEGKEYFGIHDISGYYREAKAIVDGKPLLEWEQEEAYRKNNIIGKPISKGLSREPLFVLWDAEYGTDKGWKKNKAIIAKDKIYPNNTPVHTLIVGGNHTYFANGYLVSGFATDEDYNYDNVEIKDLNL